MEQYERTVPYKEHELHVTCLRDRHGWVIDNLFITRGGTTLFPAVGDPFHFYTTGRAAEQAGMDEARHYVDNILRTKVGNA